MENNFLFQALVYLAAAVVFVPIAKRLGLGSVLGYLIAGIVIGPFVLGFIGEEGQDIMHYAEFGVVMMLFLIGLELEPELLWRMRKSIMGLGSLQVIITMVLVGCVALAFGWQWQHALAIGMITSMSSTAIVMQSLREKGLMKTVAGQSAFSVLLFQDIAVIPILALFPLLATLPGIAKDGHHATTWVNGQPGWVQTLFVLGSVVGIIIVGRLLIKPLLRIVAKTGLREIFTASALLIVVGIAALMNQVGLSPALGAFLAGVVLANSEYRHELESDIDPFKGLLLGLFFIAVGAAIDFNIIAQQPLTVLFWVAVLMTVKTVVLLLLGKFFKLSIDQNFIFSFSLSQVGEFAFVLLSFANTEGILPRETVSLFIAIVALSMALTPFVMLLNEKFILPRVGTEEKEERKADEIDEKNPVIIAGFGHFGNTVGRFLRANKIGATYLDIDSDRVDVLRRMGFKVFYGDASRHDLLHAAGAAEAKILIIAVDNAEKRLEMVETVKKHFPQLHILVRANNRYDAYDLMNAGMLHVYRESVDTSIRLGVDAMTILGYRSYTAKRLAKTFLKHDERNLKKLASIRNREEYINQARQFIEEIELIVQADAQGPMQLDTGWDAEALREEVKTL
ncbi:MAG TPA: monovalent cation:proton antiporter-2 (CPA2) family protein [Chitinophagaceae bacterium]|jgi:monovalent cation:proton antiporter-2 (CPA2) family protein|nr:monovalent cation:proton antiporter-2 (CPA2) family protein [Chitinophagaceae bacterium]